MKWHQEPPRWGVKDNQITVVTTAKTDFWRKTHYGFIRDNGHFYFQEIKGDFVAEVKVIGNYESLYDQAGLMLRFDETNWIKCGIEFVEGVQQASAVVTWDFSDWSVVALEEDPSLIWLRLARRKETVEIHYSLDGEKFRMLRLAYFPPTAAVQVGLMCASPDGEGFSVVFEDLNINYL
jgi:regulation of enolase protein 1 (concanavalin A-like superfamily)